MRGEADAAWRAKIILQACQKNLPRLPAKTEPRFRQNANNKQSFIDLKKILQSWH